ILTPVLSELTAVSQMRTRVSSELTPVSKTGTRVPSEVEGGTSELPRSAFFLQKLPHHLPHPLTGRGFDFDQVLHQAYFRYFDVNDVLGDMPRRILDQSRSRINQQR